jgi:CRP-like cAMP-binding protein
MDFNHGTQTRSTFGPGTCLSELDAASLDAIMSAAVRRTLKKAKFVCVEGERCPGLIIIESGWVQGVKVSPQGREQEIGLAGPGEMINEISVMAGEINLVTLKTLENSIIWIIDREIILGLMTKHPILSNLITQNLAKRLVHLLNIVEDLALRNVEGRLAHLLLSYSTSNLMQNDHWSTREEMAARIGTTSVVISRVLHEMEDQGAIRLDGHEIFIVNSDMLEAVAFNEYK